MALSKAPISDIFKDLMVEVGIETISGKTADFIVSVNRQWLDSGMITPAQEKPIRDIHERHFK